MSGVQPAEARDESPAHDEAHQQVSPQDAPHAGIVTKLTQLVRIADAVPEPTASRSIRQLSQLAPPLVEEISNHLREQDRRIAELENLATTDALTHVLNRRGFVERLAHELSVARRHGVGGVLIFVDLDGFKPINDTFGPVSYTHLTLPTKA